ncbi:MAG: hypothetical protein WCX82_03920 [archaeon]|jgi:drug/metabolite transporter (DMT)-like permease
MWILLAFLTALIEAIAVHFDYLTINKYMTDYKAMFLVVALCNFLVFVVIYLLKGSTSAIPLVTIGLAMLAGLIFAYGCFLFYKSFKMEEVSVVSAVVYIYIIFLVILNLVIGTGDKLNAFNIIGIVLIVVSIFIFLIKDFKKLRLSKGVEVVILSAIVFSFAYFLMGICMKQFNDSLVVYSYFRLGYAIGMLVFALIYFSEFKKTFKQFGTKTIYLQLISNVLYITAYLLLFYAFASGKNIALVIAITAVYPFLVFILAIILSKTHPVILQEDLSRSRFIKKAIAIIILIVGIILVSSF